jgi:hypothetical protein
LPVLIDQLPPDSHCASSSQTPPDGVLELEVPELEPELLLSTVLVPTRMTSVTGFLINLDLILVRRTSSPLCRTNR